MTFGSSAETSIGLSYSSQPLLFHRICLLVINHPLFITILITLHSFIIKSIFQNIIYRFFNLYRIFTAMGGNRRSSRAQSSKPAAASSTSRQRSSHTKRLERPAQKKSEAVYRKPKDCSTAIASNPRPPVPHPALAVPEKESESEVNYSVQGTQSEIELSPQTGRAWFFPEGAVPQEVKQSIQKHQNSFAVLSNIEEAPHEPIPWESLSEKQSEAYPTLEDWPWTNDSNRMERLVTLVYTPSSSYELFTYD